MVKKSKMRSALALVLALTLAIGLGINTEQAAAASDPYDVPEYVLRVGASTNDSSKIRLAQQALNTVCNERLAVDGGYGPLMQAAVKRYQSSRRLSSDGKVGRTTWDYLMGEYLAYQQLKMHTDYRIMQGGTTNGCLDIPMEAQYSDGARVQLWTVVNNNKNQLFYLTRNTDGSYVINVRVSGKVLEVRNSSMSNGGQVVQWEFKSGYKCKHWYIVYDRARKAYEIINQNSGRALDLPGNNLTKSVKYQQYSRNNTLAQRFTFKAASSSSDNTTKPSTPSTSTGQYNVSAALKFAKANVYKHTDWMCAEYVSRCLRAGGLNISIERGVRGLYQKLNRSGWGTMMKLKVESNGTVLYSKNKGKIKAGDPVIMYCSACVRYDGKPYVHTVMVSDINNKKGVKVYAHHKAKNNVVYQGFDSCYIHGSRGGVTAYVYHFK